MHRMIKYWSLGAFLGALFLPLVAEDRVCIYTLQGEELLVTVDARASLHEIHAQCLQQGIEMQGLVWMLDTDSSFLTPTIEAVQQGGDLGYPRDYYQTLTAKNKEDIHYIVSCLARKNLAAILFSQAALKAAGDRVDHVHPLRFLNEILSQDKLLVDIRNMQRRKEIWDHFLEGLTRSLETEKRKNNMKMEYLVHFSMGLRIDYKALFPCIEASQWREFVDKVVALVPRSADCDRFDFRMP